MTTSRQDPLDVIAGHLASGHSAGLTVADKRRLDLMRDLLNEAAVWSNPPPELLEQAAARIQAMRHRGLHAATRPGRAARLTSGTAMFVIELAAAMRISTAWRGVGRTERGQGGLPSPDEP